MATIEHREGYVRVLVAGGPVGPPGPPNAGVALQGMATAWPPATTPHRGDLWVVPSTPPAGAPTWALAGHGAFWDGTAWVDAGLLRGPAGEKGEPGPPLNIKGTATAWVPDASPKAGDVWILPSVLPPGVPAGFTAGGAAAWDATRSVWVPLSAIQGPAGQSIQVFGPSPAPPIGVPLHKGDIWLSSDPSLFSPTFDPSTIVPVPGPAGPAGPAGPSAYETWKTIVGRPTAPQSEYLDAIKGAPGATGAKGPAGETLKVEGIVANEAALPTSPPNLTVYMTRDGVLYIYNPTSAAAAASGWVNLGKISGPAGAPATMTPAVATDADRPAAGLPGQMVYVTDTGHLWGWDDVAKVWVDGGKVGTGAGSIDDGNAQGQMLTWDNTSARWVAADILRLPDGSDDGDLISWDAALGQWVSTTNEMGSEENVDLPQTPADGEGAVPVYDYDNNRWDVRRLRIDELDGGPGAYVPAAGDLLGWDAVLGRYVPTPAPAGTLSDLTDVDDTTPPTDGQVPAWDAATSKWTPKTITSPIVFIGTGALVVADVSDATKNYGMPADTVPPPASYPPAPGDQYLDLATGLVSAFTGTAAGRPRSGVITGVSAPASRDMIPERLNDLIDVTIAAVADKQVLMYDAAASAWKNKTLAAGPKGDTGPAGPIGPGLIQAMTVSEYNALAVKAANTLYLVYGT
jgi:hypothetical protein